MKELLADLGLLAALRNLNRDDLAKRLGSTRQNLISAFKGRRPLPTAQMPQLRQALGLDDSYHFERGRVHGLTVSQGEKQRKALLSLMQRCMTWPMRSKRLLRGIGEDRCGFAYVFEDNRGALLVVRNDDALLDARKDVDDGTEYAMQAVDGHMVDLFSRADGSPEHEIMLEAFNALFQANMSAEDLHAALNSTIKVWTWAKLKEKAEQAGHNAESVARTLGLFD